SSSVNRLRVVLLLLPTFVPACEICEAPFEAVLPLITMAPIGLPATHPVSLTGVYPVKKKLAREYPKRAVFKNDGENTCCSCTLATCSRRLSFTRLSGLADGVVARLSSTVALHGPADLVRRNENIFL